MESILLNARMEYTTATVTMNISLALHITINTINRFLSVLNHFSGVYNTYGWDGCKLQLEICADRLSLIRTKYRHCIQYMYQFYIYLMDNQQKKCISLKMHYMELRIICAKMNKKQKNGDGMPGNQKYSGSHCKSTLHRKGRGGLEG